MWTLCTHLNPSFSQPPPAVAAFLLTMLVFLKRIAVIDTLAASSELQNDIGRFMPSQWSHPPVQINQRQLGFSADLVSKPMTQTKTQFSHNH